MRKSDIDYLLEAAVAKALGLKLPRPITTRLAQNRAAAQVHRPISHAA